MKNMPVFCDFPIIVSGIVSVWKKLAGQRCWYAIGSFTIQPSEFAKSATSLALAKYLSDSQINLKANRQIQVLAMCFCQSFLSYRNPILGALIYSVFFIVLYREGLPAWYIWTGFITIFLFMLSLLLEPQYVIPIALLAVIIVHFKSECPHREY
jgi:rod shape determining protein RodA